MVDVEALTLQWLRARTDFPGVTFGTQRPPDLAAHLPYVLVTRIGGAANQVSWRGGLLLDRAGVNVQAWSTPDRAQTRALIHMVVSSLFAARSAALPGGVIVRVAMLAGPTDLPDPAMSDQVYRFTATVQLIVRQLARWAVEQAETLPSDTS